MNNDNSDNRWVKGVKIIAFTTVRLESDYFLSALLEKHEGGYVFPSLMRQGGEGSLATAVRLMRKEGLPVTIPPQQLGKPYIYKDDLGETAYYVTALTMTRSLLEWVSARRERLMFFPVDSIPRQRDLSLESDSKVWANTIMAPIIDMTWPRTGRVRRPEHLAA